MKKIFPFLVVFIITTNVFAQKPSWIIDKPRNEKFPREKFLTGFALNLGDNTGQFSEELKTSAKAELIENIQVSLQSEKVYHKSERDGNFSEDFISSTLTFANADLKGLHIEYYYDDETQTGYAFSYVNKTELKDYYKTKISFLIQQIENLINDAKQLELTNNKGRAKKVYEESKSHLEDLGFSQSLLIAIGDDHENVQIEKSLALESEIIYATTRMQSAIIVYIKSEEENLGQQVNLLNPKLKALLSQHGCSYTDDIDKADWILTIKAETRQGNEIEGIFFSYMDVIISLIDQFTKKEIYSNNFTDIKGAGLNYKVAGRKAYDKGLKHITDEIILSIER